VQPPGDIRNCWRPWPGRALLLPPVFSTASRPVSGLRGHSFGNLFLTSASPAITAAFESAVTAAAGFLAVQGQVCPATTAMCGSGRTRDTATG